MQTKMLPQIRGVLIDLSGTVHVGEKAIPGAVEALARLRQSGIPVRRRHSGLVVAKKKGRDEKTRFLPFFFFAVSITDGSRP